MSFSWIPLASLGPSPYYRETDLGDATDPRSIYITVDAAPQVTVTTGYDLSDKTLEWVFETLDGTTDLLTIADGDITKQYKNATATIPSSITGVERTLKSTIRETGTLVTAAVVLIFITYESVGD